MTWKDKVPCCFGDQDCIFGEHPYDEERARKMLKDAIDAKATMEDIVAEAAKHLKSKGASKSHIAEQIRKIRRLEF